MDKQTLLSADYLDIIYDGRNKGYGGYQLRRSYGSRLRNAGGIMVLGLLALVASFGFRKKDESRVAVSPKPGVVDLKEVILPKKVIHLPPPPRPAPPPSAQIKTRLFTKPEITNDVIPDAKVMPDVSSLNEAVVGIGSDGDSAVDGTLANRNMGGTGTGIAENIKPGVPYVIVEQMPTFDGDLAGYLAAHVRYPESARQAGIEGRVIVEFIVDEQGAVTNVRVVRDIGGGCDEEALRVISAMPHWKSGRQNGHPVKVLFNLAVKFVLQ